MAEDKSPTAADQQKELAAVRAENEALKAKRTKLERMVTNREATISTLLERLAGAGALEARCAELAAMHLDAAARVGRAGAAVKATLEKVVGAAGLDAEFAAIADIHRAAARKAVEAGDAAAEARALVEKGPPCADCDE